MTERSSAKAGRLNPDAAAALRAEAEFLLGAEANLEDAKGRFLHGATWRTVRDDDSGALRAMMAARRMHDRELLKQLPQNRRVAIHGSQRRRLFWTRKTSVAIASVVAPFERLLSPESAQAPPMTLAELADHVRKLVGDAKVPHLVGVCSTSGYTAEARAARLDLPNVMLVLVEPRAGGGWNVTGTGENVSDEVLRLFDPEAAAQKLDRVRNEIERRSHDLVTGSLSAAGVAERLGLPEPFVARAFKQVASEDAELRLTRRAGEVLLYRGAPARLQETGSMNVVDRIRQLFSKEGDEAEKVNVLSERRAALAQRRDRIYEDIGKLEQREADLLGQGRANPSKVARRRLAAQLAQLRNDIARQNTTANMLNQQINVISTDIHNLTLIQQGQMAKLPDTDELTENAVKAEEMLETLKADADLVSTLETGIADAATSEEELAILKEFEAPEPSARAERETPQDVKEAMDEFETPPPREDEKEKRSADPEG